MAKKRTRPPGTPGGSRSVPGNPPKAPVGVPKYLPFAGRNIKGKQAKPRKPRGRATTPKASHDKH